MITLNSFNRTLLKTYLDNISEDQFIDEVIIPLFGKHGYSLFRHNIHGPGEHGADLIFSRYIPVFLDTEYLTVQAKAEKAYTGNVSKFSEQLNRAFKNEFPGKSAAKLTANYALLINARVHTNDANVEFAKLTDNNNNIKVLAQDNVIDMILRFDLQISSLKGQLELNEIVNLTFEDGVREIIFSGDNNLINKFLDRDLRIETRPLPPDVKALVINYAFQKWTDDPSWEAIARPISWLNAYFDYFQPNQYPKLIRIINEYINGYRSRSALDDTTEIIYKITPEQIKTFEIEFFNIVVRFTQDMKIGDYPAVESRYSAYIKSGLASPELAEIVKLISEYNRVITKIINAKEPTAKQVIREQELMKVNRELYYFLHPEQKGIEF